MVSTGDGSQNADAMQDESKINVGFVYAWERIVQKTNGSVSQVAQGSQNISLSARPVPRPCCCCRYAPLTSRGCLSIDWLVTATGSV
jgi:hypothetical protein